jgi:hypothetical protein
MTRRLISLRTETPIAFVQAVLHAYARYGIDPAVALRAARIRPEQLDDPEARITAGQLEWLGQAAMRELDDEALGWHVRHVDPCGRDSAHAGSGAAALVPSPQPAGR